MCLGTAQSPSITCSLLPTPGTLHTKKKGVVALERGELETEMLSLALRVSVCEDVGAIAVDHAVLVADAGHPERNRHLVGGGTGRRAPVPRNPIDVLRMHTVYSQMVYNTKGTRAHTHSELIRKWLWEPKGSSLEYI